MVDVISVKENTLYKVFLLSPRIDPYLTPGNLSKTLLYSSLMYLSCVIAFIVNDFLLKSNKVNNVRVLVKPRALYFSLFITVFLSITTTGLRLKFAETSLEPVLIVLNTYLAPLMFCFLITFSIYYSRSRSYLLSTQTSILIPRSFSLIFIFCGLLQFTLIGSKLFVILPILFVFCISVNNGVKIIPNKLFVFLPLALLAYPALNMYREALLLGVDNPLTAAFHAWWYVDVSFFKLAYYSILFRFIGADSVSILLSARDSIYMSSSSLEILFSSRSVAHILTYDILKYEFTMGAATSIFGQIYFIFGDIIVSCIVAFLTFIYFDKYIYFLNNSKSIFYRGLGAYLFIFTILYINEGMIFTSVKYLLISIFIYTMFRFFFTRKKRVLGEE